MSRPRQEFEITPDILMRAYSIGLFPMAESAEDQNLFWIDPEARGVFPLDKNDHLEKAGAPRALGPFRGSD